MCVLFFLLTEKCLTKIRLFRTKYAPVNQEIPKILGALSKSQSQRSNIRTEDAPGTFTA